MLRMLKMKYTYNVAEAQSQLPRLLRDVERGGTISIRRHAETVAYVLSRVQMEALVETLEVLGNPLAMRAIERHRAGRMKFVPPSAIDASSRGARRRHVT
jgi:antitoxin (DNA-binding transcriptional repressor) of toxin-antitoxin stability system